MKILTLNFLTCARKACKSSSASFPLHPREAELEIVEVDSNPLFIRNILPRVDWPALKGLCQELGLPALSDSAPEPNALFVTGDQTEAEAQAEKQGEEEADWDKATQTAKDLHRLLLETTIQSGKLVCGNCGHEYAVKEGIPNFLLPSHLV